MAAYGASPLDVYRKAKADGVQHIQMFAMLRQVFSMSLIEAKEVIIVGSGLAESLNEYQERVIAPALEAAIRQMEDEDER